MEQYDYLIVGAGLFGSVFAHEAAARGKKCLVIDRRAHIGGNVYCENIAGVNVHKYGAHIFHTSNERVWEYIGQFARMNGFVNAPLAFYKDEMYNLPFNMNTFSKMWGVRTPEQARRKIAEQIEAEHIAAPKNLEEQALALVGRDIYEKLIRGYTEKQWGRDCKELPAFIIRRLPLRFVYDNNYFSDRYQGVPEGGYTPVVQRLLQGSDVLLETDYAAFVKAYPGIAKKTLYTGAIDEYFGYRLGVLEYRSVRFETKVLDMENYQGNAVVNYTDRETPFTRVIEHKHFEFGRQEKTVVSWEYSSEWHRGSEPYYPVNDERNTALYEQYRQLAAREENVLFGGRLGEYRYYDMDKVIESALEMAEREL